MRPRTRLAVLAGALAVLTALPAQAADRVGRIYHYLRTNSDGSEPEHVRIYRRSLTEVAVNKAVSRCTNSAYVTAVLDLQQGEARELTAGRLTREGTQAAFGTLRFDPDGPAVTARVEPAPGQVFSDELDAPSRPRVLFDFDFSDLTVLLAHRSDYRARFSFGLPLVWFVEDPANFLTYLGQVQGTFEADEVHNGRPAHRFGLGGDALKGKPGTIWVDAAEGHILEARLPMPNHDSYRDFKLTLERVEDTGEEGWRNLLMSHWQGCPPPR